MNNTLRRIVSVFIGLLVTVIVIAYVFFKTEFNSARTLTKADSLSGQRIGVVQAYEADYMLSNRKDITLLRYETEGDSLVGLCYGQVDGLAYVEEGTNYFLTKTKGLKVIDGNLGQIGFTVLMSKGNEDLLQDFNAWTKEFAKTDKYIELKQKAVNSEVTDGTPITEETGTGKTIVIGYLEDYLPVSFYDVKQGVPNGTECEMLRTFANDRNYKIEWVRCTENTLFMGLVTSQIQIACLGYTDVYRQETEDGGLSYMSDPYMYTEVKILIVDDKDNVSISTFMEEDGEEE